MNRNFRVLIVDDDKDIHDVLSMTLDTKDSKKKKSLSNDLLEQLAIDTSQNMSNIDIFHAYQGDEALSILQNNTQETIDLLILDMLMPPGINGTQVMEKLSNTSQDLKIIISTAYFHDLEEQIREMAQSFKSVHLILKPFNLNLFSDLVTFILSEEENTFSNKDVLNLK